MKVLMVGVSKETQGGMYTVVENYFESKKYNEIVTWDYIPISTIGTVPFRIRYTLKGIVKIVGRLLKKDVDIIHLHMSEKGSVYRKGIILMIANIFKIKTVVHMHGADFEDWYTASTKINKKIIRKIINTSDEIIILGEYWRSIFSEVMNDEKKINILYNAVKTRPENSYKKTNKKILFLGALIQRKGIYDILEAISEIIDVIPKDVVFEFYGPGDTKGFQEKIKGYDLESRVNYCGWLDKDKKTSILSEVMINILPSYNEGLPMTILETMAYGIPNISTNVAAIPEAIENDVNGVIINPGDVTQLANVILELVNDDEKRVRYSENSYEKITHKFSIDSHIDQLLKIYGKLL